jgi:hypothetical protein
MDRPIARIAFAAWTDALFKLGHPAR